MRLLPPQRHERGAILTRLDHRPREVVALRASRDVNSRNATTEVRARREALEAADRGNDEQQGTDE